MPQSTGRIQQLFKQYGRTAVGVHLAVYTASFTGRPMHEAGCLQCCRAVQHLCGARQLKCRPDIHHMHRLCCKSCQHNSPQPGVVPADTVYATSQLSLRIPPLAMCARCRHGFLSCTRCWTSRLEPSCSASRPPWSCQAGHACKGKTPCCRSFCQAGSWERRLRAFGGAMCSPSRPMPSTGAPCSSCRCRWGHHSACLSQRSSKTECMLHAQLFSLHCAFIRPLGWCCASSSLCSAGSPASAGGYGSCGAAVGHQAVAWIQP